MMFLFRVPLLSLACFCLSLSSLAQPSLRYTLTPATDPEMRSISVALLVHTAAVDTTYLSLPSDYGGQDQLSGIQELRVTSGNATLNATDRAHVRALRHAPGAIVSVEYRVQEVRTGDIELGNHYQTVIRDGTFHALGNSWMVTPEWEDSADVEIVWTGTPPGWTFASSFGLGPGPLRTRLPMDWLRHSIWLAGNIRMRETVVNDRTVAVALAGTWSFKDSELLHLVRTIIQTERDFFDDHDFPYFLVTALLISGDNDQGGTGRLNSFGLFLSDDRTIDLRMKRLLAHEIFHTWNGDRTEREQPEQLVYWFTEGFADYYARRFLLLAGLITPAEYVADLNVVLRDYFTSSMRTARSTELLGGGGGDLSRMPYRRGDVLAHVLASTAGDGGRSLDSAVRRYLVSARRTPYPVSTSTLLEELSPLLGTDERQLLPSWISGEVTLDPHRRIINERCADLTISERRRFFLLGERWIIPLYQLVEGSSVDRRDLP